LQIGQFTRLPTDEAAGVRHHVTHSSSSSTLLCQKLACSNSSHASIQDNGESIGMSKKPISIVFTLAALAIAVFDEAREGWQMPEMVTAFCFAVSDLQYQSLLHLVILC
jgi:hypothetical protein